MQKIIQDVFCPYFYQNFFEMKLFARLSILSVVIFSSFTLAAQNSQCGTDQSDAFMEDLIRNKKNWDQVAQKGAVERFVPVQFHSFANNDGSGRLGQEAIFEALCTINERFDSLELRFYLADDIDERNNSSAFTNANANHNFFRSIRNPFAVNVYIVQSPRPSATNVLGYYSGGSNDFIVINKDNLGDMGYTFEHEIGHFFTLSHTHRGWEDAPYRPEDYGDTVRITQISSGQTGAIGVELVDGSNCGNLGWQSPLAGDGLCDTPPDYGFGQSCNCCFFQYDVWDSNGDKIEMPMLNNVMSYSNNCGDWSFTQQQVFAMKTSFDSNRRSYLRGGDVTEYTPITEPVLISLPSNGEMLENYDGVLLSWDPVPNAEEYIISIDGTVSLDFVTTDTELYVTDLRPNGSYLWTVKANNKFGSGCVSDDAFLFFTGTGSTSVDNIEGLEAFEVYPNPLESGDILNVNVQMDRTITADMNLLGLDGKLIQSLKSQQFSVGGSNVTLNTSGLTSGVYLLEMRTESGVNIEKIIIK